MNRFIATKVISESVNNHMGALRELADVFDNAAAHSTHAQEDRDMLASAAHACDFLRDLIRKHGDDIAMYHAPLSTRIGELADSVDYWVNSKSNISIVHTMSFFTHISDIIECVIVDVIRDTSMRGKIRKLFAKK